VVNKPLNAPLLTDIDLGDLLVGLVSLCIQEQYE